jgi:hypothetical protein
MFAALDWDMEPQSWDVERRADGAVLVRVHSVDNVGEPLPDAVFTFRRGDPQYEYWLRQWQGRVKLQAAETCR